MSETKVTTIFEAFSLNDKYIIAPDFHQDMVEDPIHIDAVEQYQTSELFHKGWEDGFRGGI